MQPHDFEGQLLVDALDALGDHTHVQGAAKGDHRVRDRRVVRVFDHVADERRVDLEHVDRHLAQARERGVADAEVVDGDGPGAARLLEPAQMLADGLALGERRGFSDLDVEAGARERLRLEHGENVFHEGRGRELAHRDVDREVQGLAVDLGEQIFMAWMARRGPRSPRGTIRPWCSVRDELGRERRGAVVAASGQRTRASRVTGRRVPQSTMGWK